MKFITYLLFSIRHYLDNCATWNWACVSPDCAIPLTLVMVLGFAIFILVLLMVVTLTRRK